MYHFFVAPSQIREQEVVILGSDVNHIRNVLRMKPGEELTVSNGVDGMEYPCSIVSLEGDCIRCVRKNAAQEGTELSSRIVLFQGLPKADKMELIIQKAVELGVSEIVPVSCKRCVVKLDEKKEKSRIARWQGIAEAAAKQSGRTIIPHVCEVQTYKQALDYASPLALKLIPYEHATGMVHTRELIDTLQKGQSAAVLIGPEGGFEENEITQAGQAGFEVITLGRRILRTETAGLTVLSWLMYRLE